MAALRIILIDQLTAKISSLSDIDAARDTILLSEVAFDTNSVRPHKKKIAFIYSAMRHFAIELKNEGYKVRYTKVNDPENTETLRGDIEQAIFEVNPQKIVVTEPSEYRLFQEMKGWQSAFGIPVEIRTDERFFYSHQAFAEWAHGRKNLRMEHFYREVRREFDILMDGKNPEGGKWNYDNENRKRPHGELKFPQTYKAQPDAISKEVMELVTKRFSDNFGDIEPFQFAVTSAQAREALDKFITDRLSSFGDYQDAMVQGEPWMYHSHLSFYLNCGLLCPIECVTRAERAYREGYAPLNSVEGFIRQIIGWREFIRGVYWLKMPGYETNNYFKAKRNLPNFYWDADTHMNCLRQCVNETKRNAYAHHIQRLMVLGNFALLAGLDPVQVNEWFLIVYGDAYQWVELPNVSGMILFADGGAVASKPYAASGSYLNKMSDYCQSCYYDVKQKSGAKACPFNYLYWDFFIRNEKKLHSNPRLGVVYSTLHRMTNKKLQEFRADTKRIFQALDDDDMV